MNGIRIVDTTIKRYNGRKGRPYSVSFVVAFAEGGCSFRHLELW